MDKVLLADPVGDKFCDGSMQVCHLASDWDPREFIADKQRFDEIRKCNCLKINAGIQFSFFVIIFQFW